LDFSRTTAWCWLAVGRGSGGVLGLRTAVDVDAVLQAVNGGDLALTSLVGATDNLDLVLRKVSKPLTESANSSEYLHPCGWGSSAHRTFREAPYSEAPEDC
jgi:hypothetical protein